MIVRRLLLRRIRSVLSEGEELPDLGTGKPIKKIVIPRAALLYAVKMSKVTGLPLSEIIRSEPFINYLRTFSQVAVLDLEELDETVQGSDRSSNGVLDNHSVPNRERKA